MADTFNDPQDFDAEAKKIQRRREIAQSILNRERPSLGQVIGDRYVPNMSGMTTDVLERIGANRDIDQLDAQDKLLSSNQAKAQQQFMDNNGLGHLAAGLGIPSLRSTIAAQVGQQLDYPQQEKVAEATRIEKGEQQAADRVERATTEANRIEESKRRQREHDQMLLAIKQAGGGAHGSASNPFGGASTVVGTDKDGNPVYRVTKTGGIYKFGPDGQPVAHDGAILPKPATQDAATKKAIHEANLGIQGIDDALDKLRHKDATGATGPLNAIPGSEIVRQYTDTPEAIDARAAIANIGSLKLHDRSGAAVTVSEFPRLAPFIPKVTDSPVAANRKLENLKSEYQRMQAEWSGKPAATTSSPSESQPIKVSTPEEAAALPKGTRYVRPDGKVAVKK
jgi:hypothetical protein